MSDRPPASLYRFHCDACGHTEVVASAMLTAAQRRLLVALLIQKRDSLPEGDEQLRDAIEAVLAQMAIPPDA